MRLRHATKVDIAPPHAMYSFYGLVEGTQQKLTIWKEHKSNSRTCTAPQTMEEKLRHRRERERAHHTAETENHSSHGLILQWPQQ